MKIRALAIGAAALVLPFAGACSDDAGKPSQAEVSKSLQDNASLTKEQGDCVAKALDGKVSDKVLRAIADDDEGKISDDEKKEATEAIGTAATTCVAGADGAGASTDVSVPDLTTVPE